MGVKIIGTGSYTPDKIVTNFDLEKIVDTTDEWIRTRTGIEERHIAEDGITSSDLASKASERALEMAGITADEIDLISVASISPDKIFPSTACFVQSKIGAKNATCYDLQAACSGLLYSIEVAVALLKSNPNYTTALVIGAEKLSSIVDWEDRNTCVLFGDGAAALVLKKVEGEEDMVIASKLGSDGNYTRLLQIPAGGSDIPTSQESIDKRQHFLTMEGQEVFKLAVNSMVGACRETLEKAGINKDEIKWLVPHQANFRILKAVASRLKIDVDNVYINVNKYGNTSAASIGICLDEMVRGNHVKKGDYLLLTAFGGGLTWGAILLRW